LEEQKQQDWCKLIQQMSSPRSKVGASRISVNINAQQNRLTKNLGEKHDPWVILDDQGHKLVDELSSLQL
jgi:hypothetical protein